MHNVHIEAGDQLLDANAAKDRKSNRFLRSIAAVTVWLNRGGHPPAAAVGHRLQQPTPLAGRDAGSDRAISPRPRPRSERLASR